MEFKVGKRLNDAVVEHRKTCKSYGKDTDLFEWKFIPSCCTNEFTTEIQVAKCMKCKKGVYRIRIYASPRTRIDIRLIGVPFGTSIIFLRRNE